MDEELKDVVEDTDADTADETESEKDDTEIEVEDTDASRRISSGKVPPISTQSGSAFLHLRA